MLRKYNHPIVVKQPAKPIIPVNEILKGRDPYGQMYLDYQNFLQYRELLMQELDAILDQLKNDQLFERGLCKK